MDEANQPLPFAILDNGEGLTEVTFRQAASSKDEGEDRFELTFGRSRENDAVLKDPSTSRKQGVITWVRKDLKFQIEDLESSNGTPYRAENFLFYHEH